MARAIRRLGLFVTGALAGMVLVLGAAVWGFVAAPTWLVVDETPRSADIGVVLGGGGGSRLRKGLALYDASMVDRLLLVDDRKSAWRDMLARQCPDCMVGAKRVVILEGSTSTTTDAALVAEYCSSQPVERLLVITDPYHTRRAALAFSSRFAGTGVNVSVVSSGDYNGLLRPDDEWWRDNRTLRVVWFEVSKIIFFVLTGFGFFAG